MATVIALVASIVSAVFAMIALVYARRTVRDGRLAQAEQAHERELTRLSQIAALVGEVPLASQDEEWTQHFAVTQTRLRIALAGRPGFEKCAELATGDTVFVFDAYLDAAEEVEAAIHAHLTAKSDGPPRRFYERWRSIASRRRAAPLVASQLDGPGSESTE
jgi:hypothetical protein